MNRDDQAEVDRAIDEVLAAMVAGEPRRVSAASVRQAAGERRTPGLPVWLAAAAVLVAALGIALWDRAPVAEAPVAGARWSEVPAPAAVRPAPSLDPIPAARNAIAHSPSPHRLRLRAAADAPYEGLPRLIVASIDLPDPFVTARLDADPIQIPPLGIAPLSISGLSNEPQHP